MGKKLTNEEWDKFFELMRQVINQEGTAKQKAEELLQEARARDEEVTLDEFMAWYEDIS